MSRMNQIERDIELNVLSQTKKLSDGTVDKIFIRHPRSDNCMFSYDCRLCGVANLVGEKSLQMHINGKNHQQRLKPNFTADATQFRAQLVPPVIKAGNVTVHPGQPIPPGYENELAVESYLEESNASIDKPLIGLEYVAELHDLNAKEPLYICTLCDKRCDFGNIIAHVTSHSHRMKYMDSHFPSLIAVLNRSHRFNTDMFYREEVLTHIAKLLEQKFKRQKPLVCESSDYERRKIQITEEIMNEKNFNESDFPDCEKILLEKFHLSDNDLLSSESDDEFDNYMKESKNKQERVTRFADKIKLQTPRSFLNFSRPSFGISLYPQTSKDTAPRRMFSPREFFDEATMRKQEQYIREKFRKVFQNTVDDLRKELKENQRNPEKHPKYSEEWKSFWIRRYKELISQGKDAEGHDFRPEWFEFWMKRLRELYDTEIEVKRRDVRKRYLISNDEARKIEDEILSNESKLEQRSSLKNTGCFGQSNEIFDESSDDDSRYKSSQSRTYERSPVRENDSMFITEMANDEASRKQGIKFIQKEEHKESLKVTDIAKMEIARIICEALAAQGYTDVSTEELEELIKSFLNGNPIKIEKKKEKKEVEETINNFEKLTDDDLITLLRNFSELTSDEQNHLITYISKIEKTDLLRAVRLRKYLDMGDMIIDEDEMDIEMAEATTIFDDDYEDDQLIKSINKNAGNASSIQRKDVWINVPKNVREGHVPFKKQLKRLNNLQHRANK